MRNCPAGVVRPLLTSPAAKNAQATGSVRASPPAAVAAISNEPLLSASIGKEGFGLAEDEIHNNDKATAAGSSKEDIVERQQTAAGRPRRSKKASKAVIDAGLQMLADAQVRFCTKHGNVPAGITIRDTKVSASLHDREKVKCRLFAAGTDCGTL